MLVVKYFNVILCDEKEKEHMAADGVKWFSVSRWDCCSIILLLQKNYWKQVGPTIEGQFRWLSYHVFSCE